MVSFEVNCNNCLRMIVVAVFSFCTYTYNSVSTNTYNSLISKYYGIICIRTWCIVILIVDFYKVLFLFT